MNKILKSVLSVSGFTAVTLASGYGLCCLADELLFNRYMLLPSKIASAVIDCDSERLSGVVENNIRWLENYGYEKHYLISDAGLKLTGRLVKPETESDIYVFGVHGYRGNGKRLGGITGHYIKKGYNVFIPDHVASGESEGTYCTLGTQETTDCLKWLRYMTDTFGKDIKIILHGVSMGAAIVMFMAGNESLPENVKIAIEDSGFTSITELFKIKLENHRIKHFPLIKAINFANKRRLGFDFYDINPIQSVKKAQIPMMFIHGSEDGLVPSFMVNELFDACCSESKQILKIDGANHAQCLMIGGERYFSALDSFINNNI